MVRLGSPLGVASISVLIVAAVGCASADKVNLGGRPDGGFNPTPDSDPNGVDAFQPIDAPPGIQEKTLTQTTDTTIDAGNSVACGNALGTSENSWYRVFRLSDYQISSTFHANRVTFYVDGASGAAIQVKLGTYAGAVDAATLDLAQITPLNSATATVPNGDATVAVPPPVEVPLSADVPAGSNLIVEIFSPDGTAAGNYFYIGASKNGETHPGYIRAANSACGIQTPTSMASQGLNLQVLLQVTGTY